MSSFLRLLRVELTRLRSRRAIVVIVAAMLLVPLLIAGAQAWNTRPPSESEQQRVARLIEKETDSRWVQRDLRQCLKDPTSWGITEDEDPQTACERQVLPRAEWYGTRATLDLAEVRGEAGSAVAVLLMALALLAGATFIGHDWSSGSVSNQLLFSPRRAPVWAAKATAVGAVAGIVAAIAGSLFWLALGWVASSRDLVVDGVLLDGLQQGWRGAGLAAAAAVAGYALTMLLRSTVGALGVLFAVAVAGGVTIGVLGIDGRWNPAINVDAVLRSGTTYWQDQPCGADQGGGFCSAQVPLDLSHGLWFLGIGLVVLAAASIWSFQRRDVP
ncbi:ABC transporter permease subunit [Nocardioides sambongensis]|uniref:ABC transporter permease subunit n=1 Tax=Nocardioides sambongensis TaxID=2589074 RepID=UPI00112A27D3|nr:ABC transporter permease subunit [Nocardioides sambongensis]